MSIASRCSSTPTTASIRPGRGREIAERTCMICHGENFLSSRPGAAEVWNRRIDRMVGRALCQIGPRSRTRTAS